MAKQHIYLAIDLKSFYSSVECVDRQLDPLTTNLVVADESRTEKTICLAVSPSLKIYGIPGRARLFEVVQRIREVNAQRLRDAARQGLVKKGADGAYHFVSSSCDLNALSADPSLEISYLVAPPHMARYLDLSAEVYSIYLRYVAPEDIFSYSIDEAFLDLTGYLQTYQMSAHDLTARMIHEVMQATGITAAGGLGSNLYLAKVALDIVAKHIPAGNDGVRIAELNEQTYRSLLWDHRPLTDFWRIGKATAAKLEKHYISTMGELARASLYNREWFYRTFGIDAQIMIDHAWGWEPVTMADVKAYTPRENSICEGQVLSEPYPHDKARIIVREMTDALVFRLTEKRLRTSSVTLDLAYDRENVDNGTYQGEIHMDHYGRSVPISSHGTARLENPTNLGSQLIPAVLSLFDRISNSDLTVRRITVTANRVEEDDGTYQLDLFTDAEAVQREKQLREAMLSIKSRYGKNAILKGTDFEEGATTRERNNQIGGHKAE